MAGSRSPASFLLPLSLTLSSSIFSPFLPPVIYKSSLWHFWEIYCNWNMWTYSTLPLKAFMSDNWMREKKHLGDHVISKIQGRYIVNRSYRLCSYPCLASFLTLFCQTYACILWCKKMIMTFTIFLLIFLCTEWYRWRVSSIKRSN